MELIMNKIGHIIDVATLGQEYCETFTGELIVNTITLPCTFQCAVMEFDGDRAIAHVEVLELELTSEELEGKTIREALELKRGA